MIPRTDDGRPAFASPGFLEEVERHASRLAEHLGPEWLGHYLAELERRALSDMRNRREKLDELAREAGLPDCRAHALGSVVRELERIAREAGDRSTSGAAPEVGP